MLLDYLRAEESFDVIAKPIKIGGRSALLLMIDGFVKDDIMEKVMQFFLSAKESDLAKWSTPELFAEAMIPYVEVDTQTDVHTIAAQVLSGTVACLLEGYEAVFMIDARTYPARGVEERTTIACCAEQGMVSLKRWSLIRRWCAGEFGIHN